jgi:hypothetical protein
VAETSKEGYVSKRAVDESGLHISFARGPHNCKSGTAEDIAVLTL